MERERIINKVKLYRTERGFTQSELARTVGVSRQSIISIEKGQYVPSLQLALKMARIFNVSTDDLFQLEGDE